MLTFTNFTNTRCPKKCDYPMIMLMKLMMKHGICWYRHAVVSHAMCAAPGLLPSCSTSSRIETGHHGDVPASLSHPVPSSFEAWTLADSNFLQIAELLSPLEALEQGSPTVTCACNVDTKVFGAFWSFIGIMQRVAWNLNSSGITKCRVLKRTKSPGR